MGVRGSRCRFNFGFGGVGPGVADVLGDRGGKQECLLGYADDLPSQGLLGDRADIEAVDRDCAAFWIVEARDQRKEGRFPRTGFADDRRDLTGRDVQAEVLEDGLASRLVAEGNVVEPKVAANGGKFGGVWGGRDRFGGVQDLEDSGSSSDSTLHDVVDLCEVVDRAEEIASIGSIRD